MSTFRFHRHGLAYSLKSSNEVGSALLLDDDVNDPSKNPVGGTFIFSSKGVLKAKTPDGTVTTIAPSSGGGGGGAAPILYTINRPVNTAEKIYIPVPDPTHAPIVTFWQAGAEVTANQLSNSFGITYGMFDSSGVTSTSQLRLDFEWGTDFSAPNDHLYIGVLPI